MTVYMVSEYVWMADTRYLLFAKRKDAEKEIAKYKRLTVKDGYRAGGRWEKHNLKEYKNSPDNLLEWHHNNQQERGVQLWKLEVKK